MGSVCHRDESQDYMGAFEEVKSRHDFFPHHHLSAPAKEQVRALERVTSPSEGAYRHAFISPAWLVYAQVDSVKKTIAKAEKAGAKAVIPFQPVGAKGAIGVLVDPTGAHFGIWEAAKKAKKAKKKSAPKKGAKKAKKK